MTTYSCCFISGESCAVPNWLTVRCIDETVIVVLYCDALQRGLVINRYRGGRKGCITILNDFLDTLCYCLRQLLELHLSGPVGGGRVAWHAWHVAWVLTVRWTLCGLLSGLACWCNSIKILGGDSKHKTHRFLTRYFKQTHAMTHPASFSLRCRLVLLRCKLYFVFESHCL